MTTLTIQKFHGNDAKQGIGINIVSRYSTDIFLLKRSWFCGKVFNRFLARSLCMTKCQVKPSSSIHELCMQKCYDSRKINWVKRLLLDTLMNTSSYKEPRIMKILELIWIHYSWVVWIKMYKTYFTSNKIWIDKLSLLDV